VINRKTRRGIILLALLAVLTYVLSKPARDTADSTQVSDIDTRLNYALYEFKGRMLTDNGEIHLEIEAPLLRNDASTGVGTVDQPVLHINQDDEQWYISAESAIISADRENMELAGEVRLTRENRLTGETLQIDTREVDLQVTPRTATTQAEVSIRQAGDHLTAVGMNLDMTDDSYELLDNVRARYQVP
jgi:LPS export ABC transporter protein LptC